VGSKETASVRSDLVDHTDALSDNILELVVVVLELLFLEEHNFGALRNVDRLASQAFSLSDES
jgi:hypothetical protein